MTAALTPRTFTQDRLNETATRQGLHEITDGCAPKGEKAVIDKEANEEYERTDDPVRMYLREVDSVELLSREGEIAIAKRIEAGREAMINGICQSPLTIRAIIEWRDRLVNGEMLLREIINLGAAYVGNSEGNGADK